MKRIIAITLGVLILTTSAFAEEFKFAVVDLQKALQSVDSGKKAKAQLEKEFNTKKKELDAEEAAIRKMTEDFKKQSMVLSDDAKHKKESEIQDRVAKFRELYGKSQMEIQGRERELTEPLIQKLKGVVEEIGSSRGYMMIFEKNENGIIYSTVKDDLTEEVIKTFNKKNSG